MYSASLYSRVLLYTLLLLALHMCFGRHGLSGADGVHTIYARARHTFRLIQTIEYEQTFKYYEQEQRWRVKAKQGKFLIEQTLDTSTNGARIDMVAAFDGRKHQQLSTDWKLMAVSSGPQDETTLGTNALTQPYLWLSEPTRLIMLPEIREEVAWNRAERVSRLVDEKDLDGMHVIVVELKRPKAKTLISFAPTLGYFPMKVETIRDDGAISDGIQVRKWIAFPVDKEAAIVPTEIEFAQFGTGQRAQPLAMSIRVDSNTLKVNQPIDDDIFTISPTRAETIVDRDLEKRELPPTPHQIGDAINPMMFYVTSALIALAVGSAVLAWYVRRA